MGHNNPRAALQEYQQVGVHAATSGATPHTLIAMLLQGALDRIASAKGMMQRHDAGKGTVISKTISILDGLRGSLDFEVSGGLSRRLDDLYEYCQRRLLHANATNDVAALDEVTSLLREIRDAWDAISDTIDPSASSSQSRTPASPS